MQATHLETEERTPASSPEQPTRNMVPWIFLAALVVVLVAVGTTLLVSQQSQTDTEAMLQEYVSDWESGNFADLPGYFTLGGELVNASTGASIAPEDIGAEMADLVGFATVDVHDLAVGNSDRIATAVFDIVPPNGDSLNGVSVWEVVGGEIRQQTLTYVIAYE